MIAPPWLALPIKGYGGIELVIEGLVKGLRDRGVEVELYANGDHSLRSPGIHTHSLYKDELFSEIYKPYYETVATPLAHLNFALNEIRKDGRFDIIHDHNPHIGPSYWALASQLHDVPPVLHTFHGPPFEGSTCAENGAVYKTDDLEEITHLNKLFFTGISDIIAASAPKNLQRHMLPAVHNALDFNAFPFVKKKKDYFITLARFAPYKGQHIAVNTAIKLKTRLRMAGLIDAIDSNRRLMLELSNPQSEFRASQQFRYYSDKILPATVEHRFISYVGNISGVRKMKFISEAKALLFPIQWDEPFGMAVIEALACGTPVVAMNRGAMPEIIEHGKNGFLANNEEEFEMYAAQVDKIDPARCRKSVERHFSADAMAKKYQTLYKQVIKRSRGDDY